MIALGFLQANGADDYTMVPIVKSLALACRL